jgi:hypothetical protein
MTLIKYRRKNKTKTKHKSKPKLKPKPKRIKRNSISHCENENDNDDACQVQIISSYKNKRNKTQQNNDVHNNGNIRYAVKHLQYLAEKKKEQEEKKKQEKRNKILWIAKIVGTGIGCILSVALF